MNIIKKSHIILIILFISIVPLVSAEYFTCEDETSRGSCSGTMYCGTEELFVNNGFEVISENTPKGFVYVGSSSNIELTTQSAVGNRAVHYTDQYDSFGQDIELEQGELYSFIANISGTCDRVALYYNEESGASHNLNYEARGRYWYWKAWSNWQVISMDFRAPDDFLGRLRLSCANTETLSVDMIHLERNDDSQDSVLINNCGFCGCPEGNDCQLDGTCSKAESIKLFYYAGGHRVAVKDNGELKYYHSDNLGSASALTDTTGLLTSQNNYMPFGSSVSEINFDSIFKYTGKEQDSTNLYYYGARYYDPQIGRFLTLDPIREDMNGYFYVRNNPMKYIDPDGKVVFTAAALGTWATAVALAAGVGAGSGALEYAVVLYATNGEFSWEKLGGSMAIGAGVGAATLGAGKLFTVVRTARKAQQTIAATRAAAKGVRATARAARTAAKAARTDAAKEIRFARGTIEKRWKEFGDLVEEGGERTLGQFRKSDFGSSSHVDDILGRVNNALRSGKFKDTPESARHLRAFRTELQTLQTQIKAYGQASRTLQSQTTRTAVTHGPVN